jgi:cAMP-dependent protein kinase regulator
MQEKQEYLETKVKPIMENLIFQLVSERPDNPSLFMIDWLQKTGGYNSNNLTHDEKKELESLRRDISKYREMEGANLNEEVMNSDESQEEEEEKVENLEAKKKQIKGKGPRIGVSAEVYGQFNKKEDFKPRYIKKNENQIARIKSRILQSFIFSNLDQKDVGNVIGAMDEKIYNPGDAVIRQGEQGDCLFVVESGELDCYKRFGKDALETFLKKYAAGDSFGELSLLYNAPRAATILANTKAICWALDRETFNNIVKDAARKKREKYEAFLRSVPILESIESYELSQVCDALKSCSFKEGDYVIREVKINLSNKF